MFHVLNGLKNIEVRYFPLRPKLPHSTVTFSIVFIFVITPRLLAVCFHLISLFVYYYAFIRFID